MNTNLSEFLRATSLEFLTCLALGVLSLISLPVHAEKKEPAASNQQKANPSAPPPKELTELETASRDNLKAIMVAMNTYVDEFNTYPPPQLYGKRGKGGPHPHSWRVALLPYLNQNELYKQYHFDEPWDSEANKRVVAHMPAVFRDPGADKKSVNAAYFVLVGKMLDDDKVPVKLQTIFSCKKGVRPVVVTDGMSNTLAIVEAKREIPWTKPEDITYDPAAALPEFGLRKGGFMAGLADFSVRLISDTVKEKTIKLLVSPADGEVVGNF